MPRGKSIKRAIYRVSNKKEVCNAKTGEAVPYIKYYVGKDPDETILRKDGGDATLEELVWLCDHKAEDCNAHEFVGVHRLLGRVLFSQYGRIAATKTMLEIAELGGLHGMNGIGQDKDAYKYLMVGKNGCDWDGEYA